MDELKKFIDDHRDAFETEVPGAGHRERFMNEADRYGRRRIFSRRYVVVSVAAALIGFGIFLGSRAFRDGIDPVLSEVEAFNRDFETLSEQTVFAGQRLGMDTTEILDILLDIYCDTIPLYQQLPEELSDAEKVRILKRYFNLKIKAVKQLQARLSEEEE